VSGSTEGVLASLAGQQDVPSERSGDGWDGHLGGACPVEGEGVVDGHAWYFRARGESWAFEVYEQPHVHGEEAAKAIFDTGGEHKPWPEAGWMTNSVAWAHVEASIAAFRAR
jgi:hypothetical protein